MKSAQKPRRGKAWELLAAGALLFALIWGSTRPSEASESPETFQEAQSGPERVRVIERPSKADSRVTTQKGWIGDKRIDLKVVRTNEYTKTTGWVDGERVNVKEERNHD